MQLLHGRNNMRAQLFTYQLSLKNKEDKSNARKRNAMNAVELGKVNIGFWASDMPNTKSEGLLIKEI